MKEQIKSDGFEEPRINIGTMDVYKKQFTFPQIANNDYAVEQFETLAVTQTNLQNDPTNDTTYDNFIQSAN